MDMRNQRGRGTQSGSSAGRVNGRYSDASSSRRQDYGGGSSSYDSGYGTRGFADRRNSSNSGGGYGARPSERANSGFGAARGVKKYNPLAPKKPGVAQARVVAAKDETGEICFERMTGALELHPNGYGFIRDPRASYVRQLTDPFLSSGVVDRLRLHEREGVEMVTRIRPRRGAVGPRVMTVEEVGGLDPRMYEKGLVPNFDDLEPVTPCVRLSLVPDELPPGAPPLPMSMRIMDLLTPLGKGQRALIVAPPRSGKTVLLQDMCQAMTTLHPEIKTIVLLIDERPEEVTDFRRSVADSVEVISSSLDCELESHIRVARFVTKRCKRLVEAGKDVFLLIDSITRLARAFNKWVGNTGRTMTGGVDIQAMDIPKKIFSSARYVEKEDPEGGFKPAGSLTIVGTALIDTGSRMDELIFQEFKGTGNMELVLDRNLAERRVWPAIDLTKSGTRREERLLTEAERQAANAMRRVMSDRRMSSVEAMEQMQAFFMKYDTNAELLARNFNSRF